MAVIRLADDLLSATTKEMQAYLDRTIPWSVTVPQ